MNTLKGRQREPSGHEEGLLDVRRAAGKVSYSRRHFITSTPVLLGATWALRNIYCFLRESKRVGRALGTQKISEWWAQGRSIAS